MVTDFKLRVFPWNRGTLPARFNPSALHALALRRCAELNDAISKRDWFDWTPSSSPNRWPCCTATSIRKTWKTPTMCSRRSNL